MRGNEHGTVGIRARSGVCVLYIVLDLPMGSTPPTPTVTRRNPSLSTMQVPRETICNGEDFHFLASEHPEIPSGPDGWRADTAKIYGLGREAVGTVGSSEMLIIEIPSPPCFSLVLAR